MIENIGAYSQVDYDRGYQQGKADAESEWNKDHALIKAYNDGVKKGREDAIDEYAEKLCDKVCDDAYKTIVKCSDGTFVECDMWTVDSLADLIFDLAEQLKENKNECIG